jgi:hypothetical protein
MSWLTSAQKYHDSDHECNTHRIHDHPFGAGSQIISRVFGTRGSRKLQKVFEGVENSKKTPFVIIMLYQYSAQFLLFLVSLFLQAL